jgi:hypothetical protein
VADNRLLIDNSILDTAVSTGYTTIRSENILGAERDILFLNNGGGGPLIEVNPAGMVSIQPTDTQANQSLTISNTGDADLLWTIDEQPSTTGTAKTIVLDTVWGQVELASGFDCVPPIQLGDIPWISANPTAGTTAASTADDVTVTFDATGINLGVMRADLCVNNNSITPTIQVPVILEVPPAPSLVMTKTVGLDPNICATTDAINVPAGMGGTDVTYCYTIQNAGNITLSVQNLVDDQLGVLLGPDAPFDIAPGASDFYTVTTTITQTTVNSATWSAASSSGIHLDPAGDTFGVGVVQHDIINISSTINAGLLTLSIVFSDTISPPGTGNPDDVIGFIDIDRDGSPLSGVQSFSSIYCPMPPTLGMDYFIPLPTYDSGTNTMLLIFVDEFTGSAIPAGTVNTSFTSNSVTIEIPLSFLSVLGPEEGIIDIASVVGSTLAPTDCAPDNIALTSRLEVSGSDTATVTQNDPTDVALSSIEGTTPMTWLPVWLMLLALTVMVVPAVLLRFSGKRVRK